MLLLLAFLTAASTAPAQTPKPPLYPDKTNLLVYLDAREKTVPVRSGADWQRRRAHILAAMQLVMGPVPPDSRKVALDLKVHGEETLPRVIRKKVSFAVEKGDRLTAYLLLPRHRKGKARPCSACTRPRRSARASRPASAD
jgi:hypothetical protein